MARGQTMKTPENLARVRKMRTEGKLQREIAGAIGVSVQTVNAWLKDQDGARLRARKESYRGRCKCGAQTDGSRGRINAPAICAACYARRTDTRDREISDLYALGLRVSEIAARVGVPEYIVYDATSRVRKLGGVVPHRMLSGPMAVRRARRREAVALADAGATPEEIAARLGYKNAASAAFAVRDERRKLPSDMGER